MKLHYSNFKSSLVSLATAGLLLFTCKGVAAPGTLAEVPLQTSSTSEANIMFLLDDSGSMDTNIPSEGKSRWEVLEDAMDTILNDLTGVNVGLATFSTSKDRDGGDVVYELTLLDQSDTVDFNNKVTAMNNIIDALGNNTGGNSTIPAEALQDVGRYFANDASGNCGGAANTNLTIHPDDDLVADGGLKEDIGCSALLGDKGRIVALDEAVTASCMKNFVVLMSDGLTRRDDHMRSDGTYASTGVHPLWDYDQDCTAAAQTAGSYTCGSTSNRSRDNKIGGTKDYDYDSSGSDYLDDVAQALYEIDLRPDYTDFKNNITTYTVGFSADSLNPADADYNPLLESAALQAGGTYTYATDAASLTAAFDDITATIVEQTSTSAAVTFNSSTLDSESAVYLGLFNTARWGGELKSVPLDPFSGDPQTNCDTNSTPQTANCWNASEMMDGQTAAGRAIMTYNSVSNRGVAFNMPTLFNATTDTVDQYAANFSLLDKSSSSTAIPLSVVQDLCQGPGTSHDCTSVDGVSAGTDVQLATQTYLDSITAYIRGDRSEEGGSSTYKFRTRTSKLGDLVHSAPTYAKEADWNWPASGLFPTDGSPNSSDVAYETWADTVSRDGVVYVASNDGMLHAFRTVESSSGANDAGEEIFAYIPTSVFSSAASEGLHYLADPSYSHKFYNDLSPITADVYMHYRASGGGLVDVDGDASNPINTPDMDPGDRAWRTVLLGGQRGGGRSMYLLDITDPSKFAEATSDEVVLWEFTHNDLGYSFSEPTIGMMNNGKFAAIFGNGYKSGEDGGSGDCKAKLFIVYLDGGLDGDWTDTGDYQVIDTNVGSGGDCNGLSTPAVVDIDGNGTIDRAYAGDLKGNLWAFDLCKYSGAACATSGYSLADTSNPIEPIMTAEDPSGTAQPITSAPTVTFHPTETGDHDLMVIFGTGQYLTDADKATTGVQTIYAFQDLGALENDRASGGGDGFDLDVPTPRSSNQSDFTIQTISTVGNERYLSNSNVANNDVGWMIDLPTSGERTVVEPVVLGDNLFFNTMIPNSATCTYGGDGWLMFVALENGGRPDDNVADVNGDGDINASDSVSGNVAGGLKLDNIPSKSSFLGNYQYTSTSGGTIVKNKVTPPPPCANPPCQSGIGTGRMSWRELYESD